MPVVRNDANQLVQNVIVSFALTVLLIRLYLAVSPVTIILVGNFHLAHMLWGGLLLLVANLLIIIFQSKKMLRVSSWLAGIGFGFFIDEIGKFISVNHDYYYQLAAPLIYLFFVLTVYVLLFVRRRKPRLKDKVFFLLANLEEVVDNDLQKSELNSMNKSIQEIIKKEKNEVIINLARNIDDFLKKTDLVVLKDNLPLVEKVKSELAKLNRYLIKYKFFRFSFYLAFGLRILWVIPSIVLPLANYLDDAGLRGMKRFLIETDIVSGSTEFFVLMTNMVLELAVAVGLFVALGLIWQRRRHGFILARRMLIFSIVFLGVFNVYFGQFGALISIGIDIALLMVIRGLNFKQI